MPVSKHTGILLNNTPQFTNTCDSMRYEKSYQNIIALSLDG